MGELVQITAAKEVDEVKKSATIMCDLGGNLEEAAKMFGAEVVFTNFKNAVRVTAQAILRRYLVAGKSQEEITQLMANWKPGVAVERVSDPAASLVSKWDSYSPERQKEILAQLRQKAAGK